MSKCKTQKVLNVMIIIAILAIISIIAYIFYDVKNNKIVNNTNTTIQNPINNNINNEIKEEPEQKEENIITDNKNNQNYIGKEEEESNKEENTELTKDEKAIQLAKKEWGEDNSVTFSIEEKKGNIYYIAVKSNATTISWYEVNTETWKISEFY